MTVLLPTFGQQHDFVWIFGEDNGGEDYFIEGNSIDFRTSPPHLQEEALYLEMHSTMACICDAQGNPQFYTNGCQIANARHQLIENGDGINPGEVHEAYCVNDDYPWRGTYISGNRSALILPLPNTESSYYLFHKGREADSTPENYNGPLYWTMVDMSANAGAGRVLAKNVVISDTLMHFGQLTAVKHANGIDWWVFTPGGIGSNAYYRLLLDETGVNTLQQQNIGLSTTRTGGWANFSPDGTKYARYAPINDDLYLFDFNRHTGELSNFQQIVIEEEAEWVGGVAFSPNSRYLYVSSYDYIYQFDTEADDVAASRVVVAQYQYLGQFLEHNFWGMQLGPDCRLYVYCNSCDVIHVIHHPDEPGLACGFEQGAVQLPWPIFRSQPHFPNYRLGPVGDEGLPCTPVVSVEEVPLPSVEVVVYPNPAKGYMTLSPRGVSGHWQLFDGLGRSVLSTRLHTAQDVTVDVSHLPTGMYYWKLSGTPLDGKVVVGR